MKKRFGFWLLCLLFLFVVGCDLNINYDPSKRTDSGGEHQEVVDDEPKEDETTLALIAAIDAMEIPSETKTNLSLTEYYIIEGTFVSCNWTSSNLDVMAKNGTIYRRLDGTNVTVTLNASFSTTKGFSYTKTYEVTVLGYTKQERLEKAMSEISVDPILTLDTVLPTTTSDREISVTWQSSDPSIIDASGVYYLPNVQTEVTLTVTLSLGGESLSETFTTLAYESGEIQAMNKINYMQKYQDFSSGTLTNLVFDTNECLVMTCNSGLYLSPVINTSPFTELTASWSAITNSGTGSVEVQVRVKVGDSWSAFVSYGAWKMSTQNASKS